MVDWQDIATKAVLAGAGWALSWMGKLRHDVGAAHRKIRTLEERLARLETLVAEQDPLD